ncbi:MAG: nitroreductase family protein [Acidimicrobiia bacterium]
MSDTYQQTIKLRAVRAFTNSPVDAEDLLRILEAGRWTGSSRNSQPWDLIVVSDPEIRRSLSRCGRFTGPITAAPSCIVLVGRPGGSSFDIGRLAQNMMLAAAALGLGSCPVTLHNQNKARAVLGVPEDHHCRYALAVGHPSPKAEGRVARAFIPKGRRALQTMVHLDQFGSRQI